MCAGHQGRSLQPLTTQRKLPSVTSTSALMGKHREPSGSAIRGHQPGSRLWIHSRQARPLHSIHSPVSFISRARPLSLSTSLRISVVVLVEYAGFCLPQFPLPRVCWPHLDALFPSLVMRAGAVMRLRRDLSNLHFARTASEAAPSCRGS